MLKLVVSHEKFTSKTTDEAVNVDSEVSAIAEQVSHDTYLYVASDLDHFELPRSVRCNRDLLFGRPGAQKMFRRLDVPFFAWITRQYERAEALNEKGKITDSDMGELSSRYFAICDWISDRRVWDDVISATRLVDLSSYIPPKSPEKPRMWP